MIISKCIPSVLYFLWISKVCCEQIGSQKSEPTLGFKLHIVYNGQISKMLCQNGPHVRKMNFNKTNAGNKTDENVSSFMTIYQSLLVNT